MTTDPVEKCAIAMTDKSAREVIHGIAPGKSDAILAALQAGGFAVVPKEPTEAMSIAASACDWQAWDGETPRYIVRYRAMLAASNPKEEGR